MVQPTFGPTANSPVEALLHLAVLGPTVVVGLRPPWSIRLLAMPLAPLVIGLNLALVAFLGRKVRAKNEALWPARMLLLGVGLMVLSAFVLTPNKVEPSGRHLLALAVPAAIFMAEFLHTLNRPHPALGRALALGLVVFQGWGTVQCAVAAPPGITAQLAETMQISQRDVMAAAAFLKDNGETRGFTTYWLSYSLAFLSQEQVIYAARLPSQANMQFSAHDSLVYPAYTDMACQSPRVAYVTAHLPELDQRLRGGLTRLGVTFKENQIGDVHIIYALSRKVLPQDLGLGGGCGEP
jgi:hypothetical protein